MAGRIDRTRLVDHGGDGKAADARVGQDLRQVSGVPGGARTRRSPRSVPVPWCA